MLNMNMYSLPHNSSVYLFVHLDTNHSFCDVLDNTSASMVELVRHTLVDGTIHLDVDIITDSVGAKVSGEMDITFPPERASQKITLRDLCPCPAGISNDLLLLLLLVSSLSLSL